MCHCVVIYSRLPNIQGKSKKFRVIGSSKKIAGGKGKKQLVRVIKGKII